ncbi:ArsR/SmtB family transcription factor [Thermaurantiacus tibetensis]|uniref:ArsR/SmtB family transcription factor n=1 Tax=Thermaurantiacus tibetensis TaxID=2759035 RepID=UPI0018908961|nr:metalloregulator ArsR/SmtB family transcription factor [Thermaurantiacus tibetensis]
MDRLLASFAALADPSRLRILLLVRDVDLAMGELAEVLRQSQPRVSRHVRILAEAGLVRRQKEGAYAFVGRARTPEADAAHAMIDRLLDGADPIAPERAHLADVRAARQKALDRWFADHAEEWDLMRNLEAPAEAVEQAVVAASREGGVGRLLDIGTGTGRMLELLAPLAASATGVDRSPEMLRIARTRLDVAGLSGVEIRQADMAALPFPEGAFDTVVIHQVLHFSEDPAAAVREAARVLAPGGKLLVADYAPHAEEELRSRYRHARLGFACEAVERLFADAGLGFAHVARIAGPRLTVELWKGAKP